MELHRNDIQTIQKELKAESDWVEFDLIRRRALRAAISSGRINFFIRNLNGEVPAISIWLPEGGPRPFFAKIVEATSNELEDPEHGNIAFGVENLGDLQDPAEKLERIGQALPEFLDKFYTNARGVPIRIFANIDDFRSNEPLATIDFPEGANRPKILVNKDKLS